MPSSGWRPTCCSGTEPRATVVRILILVIAAGSGGRVTAAPVAAEAGRAGEATAAALDEALAEGADAEEVAEGTAHDASFRWLFR